MWTRLEQEGRLIQDSAAAKGVNQTNLLNFVPTRPIQDIATEYMEAFSTLYEPNAYIDRVYSYFLKLPPQRYKQTLQEQAAQPAGGTTPGKAADTTPAGKKGMSWVDLRALAIVVWRQGIKRDTRLRFWRALLGMARHNPARFKGFISILAHSEHFLEYRQIVRREIQEQIAGLPADPSHSLMVAPPQMVAG
jgi:hypothetical protein